MEELSERCALLKGLPPDANERLARESFIYAREAFRGKTEAFHCHQDGDNERRWIVLFTTSEVAKQCIQLGAWQVDFGNGNSCTVTPDYCAECIIPEEWSRQKEEWCFVNKEMFTDSLTSTASTVIPRTPAAQRHRLQQSDSTRSSDTSMMSSEYVDIGSTLFASSKTETEENNLGTKNRTSSEPHVTMNVKNSDEGVVSLGPTKQEKHWDKCITGSGSGYSEESFPSSEMYGSGRVSECSVKSMDMFGSGSKITQNANVRLAKSELVDGLSSVKSIDMYGSGYKIPQNANKSGSSVPDQDESNVSDVHTDAQPNLKHMETPLSPSGYAFIPTVDELTPTGSSHPAAGNGYPMPPWPQGAPYYPAHIPSQTIYPMMHEPPQGYYSDGSYPMPQYPGGPPMYYAPYPMMQHYPPHSFPVHHDTYLHAALRRSEGNTQPQTENYLMGRTDRPPMALPRESATVDPGNTETRAVHKDPNSPGVNCHPKVEMAVSTTDIDRYGYMKTDAMYREEIPEDAEAMDRRPDRENIPTAVVQSNLVKDADAMYRPDREEIPEDAYAMYRKPDSKKIPTAVVQPNVVQDETTYMKIIDVDVKSQIQFPDKSWKPQLPERPPTDLRHNRLTEPPMHQPDSEETCKIKVLGISERTSKETLGLFFENKKSSGGDEIVTIEYMADAGEAIIEFQSTAVVESVMRRSEKSPLRLNSNTLTVQSYVPPPTDHNKLFVSGIAETTTQESLEMYLEAKCHINASSVVYGDTPGTALITFTTPPDIEKVRMECKRRLLESSVLSVSPVSVSRCVKVTGFGVDSTSDNLLYYFENGRRSGGGAVETTDRDSIDNACLVYFENAEDANRVCEPKRQHTIDDTLLSVRLHYKCLEPDPSLILKIPPPIQFDELNTYLVRFIHNCKPLRKNLEDVMAASYANIIWPATKDDCLEIICTLEQGHKDGRRIVQDWDQICRANLGACTQKLVTHDPLYSAQEVCSCMKDRLREISVEDPESVALFVNQDDQGIIIVGKQDAAQRLWKEVVSIISDLEQKLANEKQSITKVKTVKVYQLTLLNICKFVNDVAKKGFDAKINQEKREITFNGMKKDVDDAMAKMHKFLNSFERSTISLPKLAKDLLFARQTRDHIRGQMRKAHVIGVWDAIRGEDLVIYSKSVKDLDTVSNILRRCLPSKTIPLDLNMEELLKGDSGKAHIDNLRGKYEGFIKVRLTTRELFFVTVDYLFNDVTEDCMKFFDLHALISEFIHVDPGKLRFIYSHCKRNLKLIEDQYNRLAVRIMEVDKRTRHGFKIEGKKDGCLLAITRLQMFVDKILCRNYTVKSLSANKLFGSKEGMSELKNLEMEEKCVLLVDSPGMRLDSSSAGSAPLEQAACLVNDCKLVVMEGDLTEMKVDAIVNPSTRLLQHKLGLSGAIIDKGGYNIQKECEAFVAKKGPLADAELYVSGPGSLPCKHIIHAVIPIWCDGTRSEDCRLKLAVKHCLEEAERRQFKTIVFPAAGARQFRFPLDKVTQVLVQTVLTHLQLGTGQSSLQCVSFCDIRAAPVNQFISTLKMRLGPKKVQEMTPVAHAMHSGHESSPDSPGGSLEEVFADDSGAFRSRDSPIHVTVVKGELAKQEVDVLVNSTNQKLDVRIGAISRSLLTIGGEAFLQDCVTNYPDGIRLGEVAKTTGGKLQCQQVFHGMLEKWDRGQGHSEKVMMTFVERCLALADKQKLTSLAFPALGTGVLGFPADIVAKLMFTAVQQHSDTHPSTGIRKILLVVYPGDKDTVATFEKIEKMQFHRHASRKRSTSPVIRRSTSTSTDMVRPSSRYPGFSIGQLTVEVTQGDITKETTGAIVNSTLADLDLQKGAVSMAILKAAGQSILTECQTPENRALMLRNEFVVTGSGRLLCQKIIHMKSKSHPTGWQKNVVRCLEEAEFLGLNSISFPALGTGGKGCSPDSVAAAMIAAFRQFANSKEYRRCLKKVRIVIFQADMVEKFVTAVSGSPPKRGLSRFFLPELFRSKPETPEDNKKLTICIYTDSEFKVASIKRALDGMFVEEKIHKSKSVLEEITEGQLRKIHGICQDCGVTVHMSSRVITLEGFSRNVARVKGEVSAYLDNIERDTTRAAASVTLPTNWSRMSLKDATQVIQLAPASAEYKFVSQKFITESGLAAANIVSIERIQNPTLYTQYIGKKSNMEQTNQGRPVERHLWHGTAGTTVNIINNSGFNRNYNQGSSHGIGVYFAVKAATSMGYCQPADVSTGNKHMYLANVLIGDFCMGMNGIRYPPAKNVGNQTVTYDSTTDNVNAPNFFVVFHDAQAYPSFHVTFK